MSVQDLNRVHRRYIRVSSSFKSAWTFHQFIQGVHKVFSNLALSQYPADFQTVYGELKEVSKNLSETTADAAKELLDGIEQNLAPLVQALLAADEQISPALLRRFFQRVKNYDDNILTQLVKFYLYSKDSPEWNFDRLDKADFLSTKVAEEYHDSRDAFVLRDPTYLREMAQSFWAALETEPATETEVANLQAEIEGMGQQIDSISSIDELHQKQLIHHYRDLKHSLGDTFFQPKVLQSILETNLSLKNHVHHLYRREEQRIIAEYQQVFELERDVPIDVKLSEELSEFRIAVDRFETQLQKENVRLDELAQLREKVRQLVPKLQPEPDPTVTGPFVPPPEARDFLREQGGPEESPATMMPETAGEDELLKEGFDAIVVALDDTNPTVDSRKIALQPEIFGLGIGPREVVAYRRLFGGGTCDRELEHFVLRAAALRSRIEHDVEEIKGILDDTAVTREAPVFANARVTVRIGDLYLRLFDHRIEQAVLGGDATEARALQLLKVRMMRTYSGLWLMVHRS